MKRKERIGDKIVTTIEESAIIQYEDILAGCSVEPEDEYETPWDNCDGWEHHLEKDDYRDHDDKRESDSRIRQGSYAGSYIVMNLPIDDCCGRMDGASKQVKAELRACAKRRFISQLKTWYEDGWSWYYAKCEFTTDDGTEYMDSCGMIDDYDYAKEYAETDCIRDVIHDLEKDGYTVAGQPDYAALQRKAQREAKQYCLQHNLNSQNWKD